MYSKSGKIAGWDIGSNDLSSGKVHLRSQTGDTTRAIEVNGGTFYVQNNGKMYASDAEISGSITASTLNLTGNANVPAAKINGRLSVDQLDTSVITTSNLSAQTISANQITTGTLNGSNVNVTNLNASNITGGTIGLSRDNNFTFITLTNSRTGRSASFGTDEINLPGVQI